MEQSGASRYWCHVCSRRVNPIMEVESMKCPFCESGFVEETAVNETSLDPVVGSPDSDRALSLWAPILLGMMANPIHHRPGRRLDPQDAADQELESLISRRRRSLAAILQSIRTRMSEYASEHQEQRDRDNDRDGQSMVLINPFNQTIIVQGGGSADPYNLGDYFLGPGLDLLMQHLHSTENDPSRYGTPPARKEAVEALRNVEVEAAMQLQCAVCLDECEVETEVKEMPCKHKFHNTCIVTWLELHSSCPVCRYQLPADESKLVSEASRSSSHHAGRRFSIPLLWPFTTLFSSSTSQPSAGDSGPSMDTPAAATDDN